MLLEAEKEKEKKGGGGINGRNSSLSKTHEAQHCVHHKSRSVFLILSNLISPRGSALICQEFF